VSKRRRLLAWMPTGILVAAFVALVGTTTRARQTSADSLARQVFQANCSGCHGAEGRGGDRAPSLVDNRTTRGRDETYFRDVIRKGTPGGMPPFAALPAEHIQALSGWLRAANATAAEAHLAGDVVAGERFFFGRGQCSTCHMVRGRGRANGPDLSAIGSSATVSEIDQALSDPAARANTVSAPGCPGWAFCPNSSWTLVRVTLRNGSTVRGYARSRGQRDLQLQTAEGKWLLLAQGDYAEVQSEAGSAMPPLAATADERRDLMAYLASLDGVPVGPLNNAAPPSAEDVGSVFNPPAGDWPTYNGRLSGNRHSDLTQISTQTVARLQLAWTYVLPFTGLQVTPIVVDGVMYVSGSTAVCALDARVGRQLWCYTRPAQAQDGAAGAGGRGGRGGVNAAAGPVGGGGVAGFAAFGTGNQRGVAVLGDRVFFSTADAHLIALHRLTGGVLWDVAMVPPGVSGRYGGPAAPLVIGDLVVAGISGGDTPLRGFVAAFHAHSGELAWRLWTVPARGEPAAGTWKGSMLETGGAATWLTGSFDAETGLLYWTAGNPYPPTDGREREGDNLYSNSVLAIDGRSGQLRWHYQFTPHDLFDFDANEPVLLVDAPFRGRPRKLLLQANRNGFFYVLDRTTGALLLAKPFVKKLTWASGIGADGRPQLVPDRAPSAGGVVVCPQVRGATNWYSTAYDPATRLFYVQAVEDCGYYRQGQGYFPYSNPADPPRKVLRAIDIETGTIAWEQSQVGIPEANYSGVLSTGGLVFHGENTGSFHAADARNGRSLWSFEANQAWKASPMTYAVGGRQFVAIAAGAGNILAFALPDR